MNAFGIAQENFPAKLKKTPRVRELDAEIERKHGRDEGDDGDEDEEDEEDEGPKRKKAKGSGRPTEDAEYGSDSEGNEWQLGGLAEDDEDSEIESDEAFGESDNEQFQGYSFRGSKVSKRQVGLSLRSELLPFLTKYRTNQMTLTMEMMMRARRWVRKL